MQTATSETESKSLDLSICVHHYTLRAPCPKGQGTLLQLLVCWVFGRTAVGQHGAKTVRLWRRPPKFRCRRGLRTVIFVGAWGSTISASRQCRAPSTAPQPTCSAHRASGAASTPRRISVESTVRCCRAPDSPKSNASDPAELENVDGAVLVPRAYARGHVLHSTLPVRRIGGPVRGDEHASCSWQVPHSRPWVQYPVLFRPRPLSRPI